MKNRHSSIDGFIPRRPGNQMGELHDGAQKAFVDMPGNRLLHTDDGDATRNLGQPQKDRALGRSDIEESLYGVDSIKEPVKKLSFRQRRLIARKSQKPVSKARRIVKWFVITIIVVILAIGGYVGYKFITAGSNIFQGNIFDFFSSQPLKQDINGRSNFLVLGTSEDDPGHPGSTLTDSMMVISIDQKDKNIYMFSVPRDLYVEYGEGCNSGYLGRINEYFGCVNDGTTAEAEQDRLTKTQTFVGDIFGLDIQYGAHINHTVIKEAVDAVGGVDVDIQGSNGDSGVYDRNFDWSCNSECYLVKYDNGVYHLDGEHALYLSMARGDVAPTYGLGNSNFDREKNQQKILIALKEKAMSTGTLTNLSAVTGLIDTLGNNLRTNIQTNEIRTLMKVANDVKSEDVHTLSLVGEDDAVVTTGNYNGASVVMPSAGMYNYNDIRAFIERNLTNGAVSLEAAPIVVLNGTNQSGFAQINADVLIEKGFNVTFVDNAPEGIYGQAEIYQIGTGNDETANRLSSIFNASIKKTAPPLAVNDDIRFVIIFGDATS